MEGGSCCCAANEVLVLKKEGPLPAERFPEDGGGTLRVMR